MSGTKRKAAPPKSFDYTCLPESEAGIAREAARSIRDRDLRVRRRWLGDAYDVHRVHEAIRGGRGADIGAGHFRGWILAETPFSERTAYNLSAAAAMLLKAIGSAKFAHIPPINRVVAYRLADRNTPQEVRDAFLPRLVAGERVTLRELDAALNPEADEQPAPAAMPDPEPPPEPTPAVTAFVRSLRHRDRVLIRQLAETGQLAMLAQAVEAAEWAEADPFAQPIAEADADRLADRADEAIHETPLLALPAPGTVAPVVTDEDENAADAVADSDSKSATVH